MPGEGYDYSARDEAVRQIAAMAASLSTLRADMWEGVRKGVYSVNGRRTDPPPMPRLWDGDNS